MTDACLFPSNDTPEFRRAFVACFAGWASLYELYVRGSDRRQACVCLAKNLAVTAAAVAVLQATFSTATWTIPPSHAALADGAGLLFVTFEWCDLLCYHLLRPSLDLSMVVHHLLHGALGLLAGRRCEGRVVPVMMLCQEGSSIFLNVRYLLARGTPPHAAATAAFAVTFLVLRGALGWIPFAVMLLRTGGKLEADAVLVGAGYLLQLRWCALVWAKVRGRR